MGHRYPASAFAFAAWLLIGVSGWSHDASSEESSRRRPYWVNVGLGIGGGLGNGAEGGGFALGLSFDHEALGGVVGLRGPVMTNPFEPNWHMNEATNAGHPDEFEGAADVGILYGQQLAVGRWGHVVVLAGVGMAVGGTERTERFDCGDLDPLV